MRTLLIVIAMLGSRPADACSVAYVEMFTRFEQAPVVVVGTSRAFSAGVHTRILRSRSD